MLAGDVCRVLLTMSVSRVVEEALAGVESEGLDAAVWKLPFSKGPLKGFLLVNGSSVVILISGG